MREASIKEIMAIVAAEQRESYKEGIAEGLRRAERIFVWWSSNHKLVEPHPENLLIAWSETELSELKARLQ